MPEKQLRTKLRAPVNFSQSSLQDYTDCSRRFQLRYIEQLQWPAVESAPVLENERRQVEGQQFHRMLQQYLLGLPVEKITHMAANSDSENLVRWWNNFTSARLTTLAGLEGQNFFPEHTLSAPVGSHRAMAKYDLIAVKDGLPTIYDWKTYHKLPKDEWMLASLQTKVYLSMLVKAGAHLNGGNLFAAEQVVMVYWYADFPDEPTRIMYDTAQFQRDWDGLTSLIGEISARQSFPLTGDQKKCSFCSYRSYCERGVSAGEGEDSDPATQTSWDVNLEQIQEIEF